MLSIQAPSENDIAEFVNAKQDSAFALSELYAFLYLKKKYPGWKIRRLRRKNGRPVDFILERGNARKRIYVEVKFNHKDISYKQLEYLRKKETISIFLLITNTEAKRTCYKNRDIEYRLQLKDEFHTDIGKFLVYRIWFGCKNSEPEYLKERLCLSDLDIMILLELPTYQEGMIKKLVERGYSERTVRYRIHQLVKAGIVKRSRREPYRDKSIRWVHLDLTYNWKGLIGRLADKHIKK